MGARHALKALAAHPSRIKAAASIHGGRMVTDGRSNVESSYQVALTTVFASREAREIYRQHPGHALFKDTACTPNVERYLVYDFA